MNHAIVVQIGLRKTGTRSLMIALGQLGWNVYWRGDDERILGGQRNGRKILDAVVPAYNAFCDGPYYEHMVRIAREYPQAKFVYTPRDIDDWVAAAEASQLRKRATLPTGYRQTQRARYLSNQQRVESCFGGGNPRLLVLPICHGAGWELLCPFLGVPEPAELLFPGENVWRRPEADCRRQAGYLGREWLCLA